MGVLSSVYFLALLTTCWIHCASAYLPVAKCKQTADRATGINAFFPSFYFLLSVFLLYLYFFAKIRKYVFNPLAWRQDPADLHGHAYFILFTICTVYVYACAKKRKKNEKMLKKKKIKFSAFLTWKKKTREAVKLRVIDLNSRFTWLRFVCFYSFIPVLVVCTFGFWPNITAWLVWHLYTHTRSEK